MIENIEVRKYNGKEVIVACKVKHTSGVSIFYFTYGKGTKNKLNFNFILN